MKNQFLVIFITILNTYCYSQISFDKGYYINNNNEKVECYIKNMDWKNNPVEFLFKLSENNEQQTATLKSIKEFGIYNYSKYIRITVNIDRSSNILENLSVNRNPDFNEEELFLKVLIEGKSNLYIYEDRNLVRYFYSTESKNIEQLIFKRYNSTKNLIGENNRFKQQLLNDLKCESIRIKDIESLEYKKEDLMNFFTKYNECNNSEIINFEEKQKKDLFNLTIRPRLNSSSLTINNTENNYKNTDFGNKTGLGFGLEAEIVLPFNKNKWSILVEPTYQYFKSEKELATTNAKADYKSIELPIGIRHYFFLNNNSKIFINALYILDIKANSKIYFNPGSDLDISSSTNNAFGVGFKQNGKYSLEFRYQTTRHILGNYNYWYSDYKTLSLIFGYTIF
ncbi:hypothetical protein EV196_102617 [Mariniflexile fucanivorans]|uniref:Outer membrane protein with beta-barrel domain n=1 Tax=Mariniflexile fucanivorans TaxID=264023 RepID=A0A4R1RNZ7_9FLAO|nr:tRNA modification GTPase [Mariniflexile fucanivorans]TCL68053.1 hypothetical protein EV196_102617 [Mariniflexile fucanivorans]